MSLPPGLVQTVMAIKIYSERIMPPFYRSRTAAFSRRCTGWIRHGIAEIIKMGGVKDLALIELLEAAGWFSEDCLYGGYGARFRNRWAFWPIFSWP